MFVAPYEANLLITGRCNLSCRHCGVFSRGPLADDLPLRDWIHLLSALADARLLSLTVTGGEPLVREDFQLLVDEILRRPFRFSLNTNAVLATDRIAALLREASPRLSSVMVSLDGDSPATHDAIRGDGVFRAAMEGIGRLEKAGVPLCFYCTVNRVNAGRLRETAELALLHGRWIKFNCFLDAGPGTDSRLNPDPAQVRTAAEAVLELSERFGSRIDGAFLQMARLGRRAASGEGEAFDSSRGPSCGGGRTRISILPDGWVTPCDHLPGVRLGNLLENTLEEILSSPSAARFACDHAPRRRTLERCDACPAAPLCPGSCPAAPCSELTCLLNYTPGGTA